MTLIPTVELAWLTNALSVSAGAEGTAAAVLSGGPAAKGAGIVKAEAVGCPPESAAFANTRAKSVHRANRSGRPEDSAAAHMVRDTLTVRPNITVSEAVATVREHALGSLQVLGAQ